MGNDRLKEEDMLREKARREDSLQFVAGHYRHDAFSADRDWRALGLERHSWLRRHAAAAIWGVAFAACAAVAVWMLSPSPEPQPVPAPVQEETLPPVRPTDSVSRRIEFTDASFGEVAEAVESVYGVRLGNIPDSPEKITMSYEGTASDLVATLNSLFGCDLRIVTPAPRQESDTTYQ